jgi:hypothetical protein
MTGGQAALPRAEPPFRQKAENQRTTLARVGEGRTAKPPGVRVGRWQVKLEALRRGPEVGALS